MTEIRFNICDKVVFFNTASCVIEEDEVKGIQVIPTGISKTEGGENHLDGYMVLYQLLGGLVLSDAELFSSEEECRAHYRAFFACEG